MHFSPSLQQDAKHDPQMEADAKSWLEAIAGEPFPDGSFHEALKDGVYLCKVINQLQPGSVPKINQSKMAFKMVTTIIACMFPNMMCSHCADVNLSTLVHSFIGLLHCPSHPAVALFRVLYCVFILS